MIYFRWTYDFEYGDDANEHPIIEVKQYKLQSKDLWNINFELQQIFKPEILSKAEVKILRK